MQTFKINNDTLNQAREKFKESERQRKIDIAVYKTEQENKDRSIAYDLLAVHGLVANKSWYDRDSERYHVIINDIEFRLSSDKTSLVLHKVDGIYNCGAWHLTSNPDSLGRIVNVVDIIREDRAHVDLQDQKERKFLKIVGSVFAAATIALIVFFYIFS